MRLALARGLLLVVVLASAGCRGQDDQPRQRADAPSVGAAERVTHEEGAGPLSASAGPVLSVLPVPPGATGRTWQASFGSMVLCRQSGTGQEPIVLERVRVLGPVAPTHVDFFVRTVPPGQAFTSTIMSANGAPPNFDQPYAKFEAEPEEFSPLADGFQIDSGCRTKFDIRKGFTELVVATTAGRSGAYVAEQLIDYRVGRSRYSLRLEIGFVQCGTAEALRKICAGENFG